MLEQARTIAIVGLSPKAARDSNIDVVMNRCIKVEHERLCK